MRLPPATGLPGPPPPSACFLSTNPSIPRGYPAT